MNFERLIDRPSLQTLRSVLLGRTLNFIAPYVRRGALDMILPDAHDRVQIIVRLPRLATGRAIQIDNDPRDLIDLIDRMGLKVRLYALPGVHTKLYLNGNQAYYGSANFTLTGFGRNPESLLSTEHPATYQNLQNMFATYKNDSTPITLPYLRRLRTRLEAGHIEYTASPEHPQTLIASSKGDDVGEFRSWLARINDEDSAYIEARFDPTAGYNMSGHVQSAFPGIRQFLRENLDLIPALAVQTYAQRLFWEENAEPVRRFRAFVNTKGHQFPANGGGPWRNKLPPFLGGPGPNGGGRGSGLIARMLVYLSRYAIAHGF